MIGNPMGNVLGNPLGNPLALSKSAGSGLNIGDIGYFSEAPGSNFIRADGRSYRQSDYPRLFDKIGLIANVRESVVSRTSYPSSAGSRSVVNLNGSLFTSAPGTAICYRSSNGGLAWNGSATLPSSGTWLLASSKTRVVAVRQSTNQAAWSVDGITWVPVTIPATALWLRVIAGPEKSILAFSADGKIVYSLDDGSTWAEGQLPITNVTDVCYGNGKWIAVARALSNNTSMTQDLISWNVFTSVAMNLMSVCYGNGIFVVGGQGAITGFSNDGDNWFSLTQPSISNGIGRIICGDGLFVGVSTVSAELYLLYSSDGIRWDTKIFPASSQWYDLAFTDTALCVVSLSSVEVASMSKFGFSPATNFAVPSASNSAGKTAYVRAL